MKTFEIIHEDYIGNQFTDIVEAESEKAAVDKLEDQLAYCYGWGNYQFIKVQELAK